MPNTSERLSTVGYLILHGWQGSGPDHWQTWLADRLRADGHDVRYPALPDPDHPRLADWLRALDTEREPGDRITSVIPCRAQISAMLKTAWLLFIIRNVVCPCERNAVERGNLSCTLELLT